MRVSRTTVGYRMRTARSGRDIDGTGEVDGHQAGQRGEARKDGNQASGDGSATTVDSARPGAQPAGQDTARPDTA